jgi:hypothetical protein
VVTSLAANQALASLMVGNGYVPPVLTTSGTDISGGTGTTKIVTGQITLVFTASVYPATVIVPLTGAAIFSSSTSYKVVGMLNALGVNSPIVSVYTLSTSTASSLQFSATSAASGTFSVTYDFAAIGS